MRRERFLLVVGHLTFLCLFALSLVYAIERTSFVDSAWQFFSRVNNANFCFPEYRYGVFVSEIPLWIAVKIGLPFNSLVYIFSATYIALYYCVWLLCVYPLKNAGAGVALLLWLCIGMNFSFLHTVTESHQAMVYSILVFALISNNSNINSRLQTSLIVITSTLALFCHPFAVFSLAFVALWPVIKNHNYRDRNTWILLGLGGFITAARYFFFHGSYDAQHYDRLKSMPFAEIARNGSYPLKFYALVFFEQYVLVTLVIITSIALLLLHKKYRMLFWMTLSVVLYMSVISIGLYNGDSHIMMERIYLPAFLMIYFVLGDQVTDPRFHYQKARNILLPIALLIGLYQLNQGCIVYRKRIEYLCNTIKEGQVQFGEDHDKFIIRPSQVDSAKVQLDWALGTETMVITKFKFDRTITVCLSDTSNPCDTNMFVAAKLLDMPIESLNRAYFSLSRNKYNVIDIH